MPKVDTEKYRVHSGFSLSKIDTKETQHLDKGASKLQLEQNLKVMDQLQERLYAQNTQSLLIVIQAMDAGGKDSTIKSLTHGLNPQGVRVASFKAPSTLEKSHDFLWRVHQQVPPTGHITIFNRSHYEEVLIVRVKKWVDESVIKKRYKHINHFEEMLSDQGTHILKFMLHISPEYQLQQFKDRLEDPEKHWKFNPEDFEERKSWKAYMESFELMLNNCSTDYAPWYVLPAENKWFRSLVMSEVILKKLREINPQFPPPQFNLKDYKI